MTIIRSETLGDVGAVREVNELAFGQPAEASLVDKLRQSCGEALSLVAVDEARAAIVGHILFTPVVVESHGRRVVGMGLAPMAVHPDCQREGIGSELVRHGLRILAGRGCPFVVVVGHPRVLSALRLRTRVAAPPGEPVGRHARRGLHGDDPRPTGHEGRRRCCQVSHRVRRGRVSVLPEITIRDAGGRDVVARFRGASLEDVPAHRTAHRSLRAQPEPGGLLRRSNRGGAWDGSRR